MKEELDNLREEFETKADMVQTPTNEQQQEPSNSQRPESMFRPNEQQQEPSNEQEQKIPEDESQRTQPNKKKENKLDNIIDGLGELNLRNSQLYVQNEMNGKNWPLLYCKEVCFSFLKNLHFFLNECCF